LIQILCCCGDRNDLLFSIRDSGYGKEYEAKIECPECKEQFDHVFDLSQLEIQRLSAEPIHPNINLFDYVLPISKVPVQFRLLIGKDEDAISKELERKKKITKSQIDNSVTTRLFYSIVSFAGETDRTKIMRSINTMRAGDARALRKYMQKIEPTVIMEQWAKCSHCGEESKVDVPLGLRILLSRHAIKKYFC